MTRLLTERPVRAMAAHVGQEPHRATGVGSSLAVHRAISLSALLGLFWPLMSTFGNVVSSPATGIAVVALAGGGLFLLIAVSSVQSSDALAQLDRWVLALGLLVLAVSVSAKLAASSGYGTDEAAFEQGAASLLLHGHDPYGANLTASLAAFSTPTKYLTYTMSGGTVSTFGYPALPLLVVAPFVQLTHGGQAVPIADTLVLMLAVVLLFTHLPQAWRGLAIVLCVGFPALAGFAYAGVNLIIAMTALLVAVHRWTATGRGGGLSRADRVRCVALGLALSCNQLAWFITPFLLTGIWLMRRGELDSRRALRVVLRYLGVALGTFAAVNAPFFFWGPGAWLHGVIAPLTQHAIPYGQGLVGLTLFLRLGGGAMDAYNYAAALLYVALLILFAARFRSLGRACCVLPLLALFVSGRSLAEYWLTMVAVIAVAALSAEDVDLRLAAAVRPWPKSLPGIGRWSMPALFLPAAACLAIGLFTQQPLSMRILSAHSSTTVRGVQDLRIRVRNRTDQTLRPHFATNVSGQAVLWQPRSGPTKLAPHASAVYRLVAPDAASMPPNGARFVVEAVTASPRTISSTSPFVQRGPAPGYW